MQRLFSSFAHGAPGVGLLLMRLAAGTGLALQVAGIWPSHPNAAALPSLLSLATALLLFLGFWTPISGVVAAGLAIWHGVVSTGDVAADVLLAVLGLALALLGPGAWSVDARLFGWKRVEIQNGNGMDSGAEGQTKSLAGKRGASDTERG